MNNRMTQIFLGLFISGVFGVGFVIMTEDAPVPEFENAPIVKPVEKVKKTSSKKTVEPEEDSSESDLPTSQENVQPQLKSVKDLIALFKSRDPSDRQDAFLEIRYAEEPYDLKELMPYLNNGVVDPDEEVRAAAVDVIGEYTDDARILPAVAMVLNGAFSEDKSQVLQHVFNMEWNAEIEGMVRTSIWDDDPEVAEIACEILNSNLDEPFESLDEARKELEHLANGGL